MRKAFVIGRTSGRRTELVVVKPPKKSPIPGPWVVEGMVEVRSGSG